MKAPAYLLKPAALADVRALCERFHGYGSAGNAAVYAYGVFEDDVMVAGYSWQPPPPGAAAAVCPEAPYGVLNLSRMVAVPRKERRLNHVSKPLRRQMRVLIDRTRWPVLITYSDLGQGHTGHVYKCSGWEKTHLGTEPIFVDDNGRRQSRYTNGKTGSRALTPAGYTEIQRWEHWICPRGAAASWMEGHGWRRERVPGRVWRSGNPAFTYVRRSEESMMTMELIEKLKAAKGLPRAEIEALCDEAAKHLAKMDTQRMALRKLASKLVESFDKSAA